MTSDSFINMCDANYAELQRKYRARGFSGESFDMVVLRCGQSWRLIEGPEPSKWLSTGVPAAHMRYGPYTQPA